MNSEEGEVPISNEWGETVEGFLQKLKTVEKKGWEPGIYNLIHGENELKYKTPFNSGKKNIKHVLKKYDTHYIGE